MLIAHGSCKEVAPGVRVWSTFDGEYPSSYLSLDDGKRWPDYVDVETLEDGKWVSRFYKIRCLMQVYDREETNQMKVRKVSYICIKESWFHEDGSFWYSWEPAEDDLRGTYRAWLKKEEMEPYIRPEAARAAE